MAIVPTAAEIGKKWARVTPERTQDYEDGVRNPKKDWAVETSAAEPNYEKGVTAAMARKAFGKGVKKAGVAKQQGNSISKGIPRFGEGVRTAEQIMVAAMEPVVRALQSITYPPKYPKRDPRNLERVRIVMDTLGKLKTG